MSYRFFGHPFSSYTWKALIALYEKEVPFDYVVVEDEESAADLRKHWPIGKFPLLVHEDDPYVNALGIKGVGEIGITGTAGAVANAVWHATGVRPRRFPVRIEDLLAGGGLG